MTLVPAQFVVGPDLRIYKAHYGADYDDQIPFIEVCEAAQFGDDNTKELGQLLDANEKRK